MSTNPSPSPSPVPVPVPVPVPATVSIIGAHGRLGRHAAAAFHAAGWQVRSLSRRAADRSVVGTPVNVDAHDAQALSRAVRGSQIIVHAVNPAYRHWDRDVPRLTHALITAARASGATLMLPGNVYGFGSGMPAQLSNATPMAPSNAFGRHRVALESACREAAGDGVRTIVVRAGSFIEGRRAGNWFEDHIIQDIARSRVRYPGPLDRVHSWAFLPDLARAFVELAHVRHPLDPFHVVPFPGWALNGRALIDELQALMGRPLTVGAMPWPLLRLMALPRNDLRGVMAMRYLWQRPHRLDGDELARQLPGFEETGVSQGLRTVLQQLNIIPEAGPATSA